MVAVLDSQFWNKLSDISASVGMQPDDLLAVMYYESGLNPAAHNKDGNASGLIQFMPDTLDALGFKEGHSAFRSLDAIDQLKYVQDYVQSKARFNGGGFKSATQYYVANLWPIALKLPGVQSEDPSTIIIDSNPTTQRYPGVSLAYERKAYASNRGLDVDGDGKITYGDLEKVMNGVKQTPGYRNALAKLSAGESVAVGGPRPSQSTTPDQTTSPTNTIDRLETLLSQYMTAFAAMNDAMETKHYHIKQAHAQNLLPNSLLIKVASESYDAAIEYARILVCALDETMYTNATIHVNESDQVVEVSCIVYGPSSLSIQATTQLCQALSAMFKTNLATLGPCSVNSQVISASSSHLPALTIQAAFASYNRFHTNLLG